MKSLRKDVLVVVQLVVTAALLFQQFPVLAIAVPVQVQSDIEVIEPAAAQGDEVAPQDAASTEVSVSDDSASAAQAVASTEPSSVPKPSNPGVWKTVGTCLWMIDESGLMTIKPESDGTGYVYRDWISDSYTYPWEGQKESVTAVVFEGDVAFGNCEKLFSGCKNLKTVDLASVRADNPIDTDMFYGCSSLCSVTVGPNVHLDSGAWDRTQNKWRSSVDDIVYRGGDFPSGVSATYTREDTVVTGSWYKYETIKWSIDDEGILTVRPFQGDSCSIEFGRYYSDVYNDVSRPWDELKGSTTKVRFEGIIKAKGDMNELFKDFRKLTSIDFGQIDTSEVVGMDRMFFGCSSLSSVDLSSLDTPSVTDMSDMFSDCSSLASIDLSSFDTSAVTDMSSMFSGCKSLTTLKLSSFDTSSVTDMDSMFCGCSSLASLDLSSFDTSKVDPSSWSYSDLFQDCPSLVKIVLGESFVSGGPGMSIPVLFPDNSKTGRWVSSVDSVAYENDGIPAGVAATYTPQNPGAIKNSWNQCGSCLWKLGDAGCLSIKPQHDDKGTLGNGFGDYLQKPETYAWLRLRNQIKEVKIADGVSTGTNASNLFNGCSNLTSVNIEALDTSNAEDMSYMFQGCSSLASLDLSKFNTSRVTSMYSMFDGCRSIKALELSSFDTGSVTWMGGMFQDCSSLRTVDVSSFDTSSVNNLSWMFSGCSSLASVDLSSFDTSSVTDAYGVFHDCGSLKRLDLSSFDMSAAREMSMFFYGCTSLQEVKFGDGFVFVGTDSFLPSQYSWDVPITWQNSKGSVFAAKDIPSFTADTYRAVVGAMPRLAGYTRYETAGLLFDQGNWQQGGSIVLASGANYPDALAASALAGDLNAPIMLTDPNGLSSETEWRIQNLKPSRVYIVGGKAAVSVNVERRVAQLAGSGASVKRIAGDTRYDTSLKVASSLSSPSDTVIVTTGTNYADALSISPYAFATGSPVVLSSPSSGLSDSALKAIKKAGYKKAVIVGGTSAVPAAVTSQLKAQGVGSITRLSGDTRYATSAKIAEFELKQNVGFTMDGAYLATGQNFPDALAAGALSGKHLVPLLLVDPGAREACSFLSKYKGKVSRVTFVGGTSAIGNAEAASITRALGVKNV